MPENPHLDILNREEPRAVAEQYFARQTELMRDLANYGSNLVIRAFNSSPKKMAEIIVCGVLLKQVVAMVDAAEVLFSAGCGHAAFLPVRTAFEASIYIDWILLADSERRATRYLVGNYRDERVWANRAISGTTEEISFSKVVNDLGVDIHKNRPTLTADAKMLLGEVNRVLAQPELLEIDKEFTEVWKKRKREPKWYALDSLTSIRQIADKVGRLAEYEFFYSKGSQVAHTDSYKDHIRFSNGQIDFIPIRHLADGNNLLNFMVPICLGTYRKILEHYRPAELTAFVQKYLNDWRDPFQNVVSVKYDF